MNFPLQGDYIDMHTHSGKPAKGVFIIESLMAHEEKLPVNEPGVAYTFGIHPWFLTESNHDRLISSVENLVINPNVLAVGEAGFDKLRGPSPELQRKAFLEQVAIAEAQKKPVIIHCVKAWDELLSVQKKLKPQTTWMIHGFRGNVELARQLLAKGFYLSIWFNFAVRPESADLLRNIPKDRIFLETDGADIDIKEIYRKVSVDLGITVEELKSMIFNNFKEFFKKTKND